MKDCLIFDRSRSGRKGATLPQLDVPLRNEIPASLRRKKDVELPELSEPQVVRHYTNLSRKNFSIDVCFYPLGSCTMKYNPKSHEEVVRLPGFAQLHPLLPQLLGGGQLTQGALAVLYEVEQWLNELLGFCAFTMQPMAGAHGELTGVMMIAAYHQKRGDRQRRYILIPDSAHGTNPASAAIAGFEVKTLPSDAEGNVDMKRYRELLGPEVAGVMLTCPNTLGLFDPNVEDICRLAHEAGALVYGDGANLNAIVGRVRPGDLGFDCMHVNLHKTFSTPHGCGGPGAGVVGVSPILEPFLPISRVGKHSDGSFFLNYDFPDSIGYIAPFYGNFGVILRAYAYLLTLGREGLIQVSENAVLNANYLRVRLKDVLKPAVDRVCMHEVVLSAKELAERTGVRALDLAKGLLQHGYHPPTIYFPLTVPECLMIEPTETESQEELDEFITVLCELCRQAEREPDVLHSYPNNLPVRRVDEVKAARNPDIACCSD
ncbi:MAG: glycine dehydrogenase subunit 2 [Lentisphaerae bacterium]|nr:MAG: glycine dehydrogenase subunit 2 [Lentisphaerota bacterium]